MIRPRPSYDAIARWFTRARSDRIGLDAVAGVIAPRPGMRVLDVGCGSGRPFAAWFSAAGCSYLGIDVSARLLAQARYRFPHMRFLRRRLESPLPARAYDLVLLYGVIFHLPASRHRAVIRHLLRAVRPGGVLVVDSGETAGETRSMVMGGRRLRHWSLADAELAAAVPGTPARIHRLEPGHALYVWTA